MQRKPEKQNVFPTPRKAPGTTSAPQHLTKNWKLPVQPQNVHTTEMQNALQTMFQSTQWAAAQAVPHLQKNNQKAALPPFSFDANRQKISDEKQACR